MIYLELKEVVTHHIIKSAPVCPFHRATEVRPALQGPRAAENAVPRGSELVPGQSETRWLAGAFVTRWEEGWMRKGELNL